MQLRLFAIALASAYSIQTLHSEDAIQAKPFQRNEGASAPTLFAKVDPSEAGLVVENNYDDPSMWGARYRAFMGGGMGSGVAAGDFDNDGKVDLYVSLKTKPGRLFKNLGNWKFADVTEDAGLLGESSLLGWLSSAVSSDEPIVWNQGAVFADVDNDGWLDLYVCRNDAPNRLYMNQRDGSFKEQAEERGLGLADGSVVGAFADYDLDGWLDVFVLTNQVDGTEPQGRPDRLFRNVGKGRFKDVTQAAGIASTSFGHSAVWFDFTGDRYPDLYIANDFAGADYLYRNNGDGTFTDVINSVAPHTSYSSMGSDAGDINNDGLVDLLAADMATTSLEKDRRGLATSRGDVLSMGTREGVVPQYMRNTLLLNTGLGVFGEAACWANLDATDWTWSVLFEDFDNDGWLDLHVTNGMVREANNSDILTQMMRALSDKQRIAAIKRSPPLNETNLAFRNLGGGEFTDVTRKWGLEDIGVSFGAATADFDSDGDLDLAYLNHDGGLSVFRNEATGQNTLQARLRGTRSNAFGVGAVIRVETETHGTLTRELIVSRGYASGGELVAHFGLGSETSVKRLTVTWPSGVVQSFENLASGHAYQITEPAKSTAAKPEPRRRLFQEAARGIGLHADDQTELALPDHEQMFLPFRTDRGGPGISVSDLNGDGFDDIFLAATQSNPAQIAFWRGDGFKTEPASGIPNAAVEDGPPLLFDADGDGFRDLLVTKASANAKLWPSDFQPVLYSNDGHGVFRVTDRLPKLAINVGAACLADIDGDGDLDVFLGGRSIPGKYPEPAASAILRNDGAAFTDVTNLSPDLKYPGLVKSAVFSDVDLDGRPDLLVALEWGFTRLYRNDGNGAFEDATERFGFQSGRRGWWNGLAAADLNRDGRPDFVVGNLGLNTTYRASPSEPATLFYGDFAQNGTNLVAEAVYDNGQLYPLRSRSDIGTRLPAVLRKYPRNDDFAKSTFHDVYDAEATGRAKRLEADNLRSGTFLSQPDGSYAFKAFPRAAQIGPIIGLAISDFDGDGFLDVCATQNSDIAVPHFDGGNGLFLRGDGSGNFTVEPTIETGLLIPGNGRGIVVLDPNRDGRPDVFNSRIGAATAFFWNLSANANRVAIRLVGPQGNPDAVGAKVAVNHSNNSSTRYEVTQGSGWRSQSSTTIFHATRDDDSIESVEIVWPDGSKSTHRDSPKRGLWKIAQPSTR